MPDHRCTLALAVLPLLALPLAAEPIRVRGEVAAPRGVAVQVELFPAAPGREEVLRQIAGEPARPVASARSQADGSFEVIAPESGLYRVVVRADGYLPMERPLVPLVEEADLPPVELEPAQSFEVQAVDADGRPVPGVPVRAISVPSTTSRSGILPWKPAERRGVTGPDGRVRLPRGSSSGRGEPLGLAVALPGFRERTVEAGEGPRHVLRLEPKPPGRVEVRDAQERPVGGALVRWGTVHLGVTGADGRLALPASDRGGVLRADAQGAWTDLYLETGIPSGETVRLELAPPRRVTGRVLQSGTRVPLAGALVWSSESHVARTAADGGFQVSVSGRGEAGLRAAAAGHLLIAQGGQIGQIGQMGRTAAGGGAGEPLTLLLERAGSLEGTVVDAAGNPIPGVAVEARPAGGRPLPGAIPLLRSVRTRPDGSFRLPGLVLRTVYHLTASREGFAPSSSPASATAPGEPPRPLRIVLGRGAMVRGRAVDESGNPVAGARLTLQPGQASPMGFRPLPGEPFRATSGAGGEFRFEHVGPGAFLLAGEGRGFARTARSDVEVGETGDLDVGDFRLQAGADLEGRVTDRSGKPLAEAMLYLLAEDPVRAMREGGRPDREPVLSGADGRFRFEDLPPGERFDVRAELPGYATTKVPGVEVPLAEPLRIELATARVLTGRVVGPEGEPIAGAEVVRVEDMERRVGRGVRRMDAALAVRTDPEGRFQMGGLEPGVLSLRVHAHGYREKTMEGLEVPEDREAPPLEIVLEKAPR